MQTLHHLEREVTQNEIQFASAIKNLLEEVRTYCLENVLDSPIESMPTLGPSHFFYNSPVTRTIDDIRCLDILSFAQPGGMKYRDAVAHLAALGNQKTAIDTGTGYGSMIPPLAERGLKVTAIDKIDLPYARRFIQHYPCAAVHQCGLGEYAGKAGFVVLSAREFFSSPEHVASQIARIAERRAIVGISVAAAPVHHFAFKDAIMPVGAFSHSVASYEPKRWARELAKHFDTVTTYRYNNRRFIIGAERK